jgi:excisionase family DNA binding protein
MCNSACMETKRLLLSKKEAAQSLGTSLRSLEYLIARKDLVSRRVGRRVLIPASALEQFARHDHPQPISPLQVERCES